MYNNLLTSFKDNKKVTVIFIFSIVLILLSLYNNFFGILAFLLDVYALAVLKPEKFIILLFSLLPWAYVYKINGVSTSLFSVLVIITALKFLIDIRTINFHFIVLMFLFIMNVFLHFSIKDTFMLGMFIKLLFNLLLLYEMCILHKTENATTILIFFVLSLLLSSAVASFFPDINLFVNRIRMESTFVEFRYERFTGLQNDPNYYNSSLVISLLSLCYLFIRKKIGISFFPLSFACVYFGFLTYSKSFFLLLLMWVAVVVFYSFIKKRYFLTIPLLVTGIIGVRYIFSGQNQQINVLINRFFDKSGVTSGRTDIWGMFVEHFKDNTLELFFGNGFETMLYQTHASHNSYLDLVYYFGIIGAIIFILIVITCFKKGTLNLRQKFPYVFMTFVFVIYFFLSGLTMCELPFILFLIYMFFNENENVSSHAK